MDNLHQLRVDLLNDFFLFNRFIFKERTGRDFIISQPDGNVSHFIEMCNALTDVFFGRIPNLAINCPPGWSKSEIVKNFICWSTAWYAFSNHIYLSYSHEFPIIYFLKWYTTGFMDSFVTCKLLPSLNNDIAIIWR